MLKRFFGHGPAEGLRGDDKTAISTASEKTDSEEVNGHALS